MNNFSDQITNNNINFVRQQINKKQSSQHFELATYDMVKKSTTDFDHYPYTRFYRGIYYKQNPMFIEREAGFRKRHDDCYEPTIHYDTIPPSNLCYESACSVVYPCYPAYLRKYSDKEQMDVMLNRTCVINSP